MRYRWVFLAGLGTGFVLGARAGRERYDQLCRLARAVADNPAVQQAAGALQAQATGLATAARNKVADQMPKLAETAKGKVSGALHRHGEHSGDTGEPLSADGSKGFASVPPDG